MAADVVVSRERWAAVMEELGRLRKEVEEMGWQGAAYRKSAAVEASVLEDVRAASQPFMGACDGLAGTQPGTITADIDRAVLAERERCAALAEAWAAPLVAQWMREGRKVVKHDASEFEYRVVDPGQGVEPDTITADMTEVVWTETMTREEAKRRWPSTPMPADEKPECVRVPGSATRKAGSEPTSPCPGGCGHAVPSETLAQFGARWDKRQEGKPPTEPDRECKWCRQAVASGTRHDPMSTVRDCTVVTVEKIPAWQELHKQMRCTHPPGCTQCNWCGMKLEGSAAAQATATAEPQVPCGGVAPGSGDRVLVERARCAAIARRWLGSEVPGVIIARRILNAIEAGEQGR